MFFSNSHISGPAHSNDDPGGEHHGAGVHRHDERGCQERAHLLPRVLPHCAQEVPRGRRRAVCPGDVQGKKPFLKIIFFSTKSSSDALWHRTLPRAFPCQEIQNQPKVSFQGIHLSIKTDQTSHTIIKSQNSGGLPLHHAQPACGRGR